MANQNIFFRGLLLALLTIAPLQAMAMSLDEAVARVRGQADGRVLSAETRQRNGSSVHVIRVLTSQGRVKEFQFDAGGGSGQPPGRRR